MRVIYSGAPRPIILEASYNAIMDADLDTFEGEQFDTIRNVISVHISGGDYVIETVRSIEALKRGEPNAGRMTMTMAAQNVERIILA